MSTYRDDFAASQIEWKIDTRTGKVRSRVVPTEAPEDRPDMPTRAEAREEL